MRKTGAGQSHRERAAVGSGGVAKSKGCWFSTLSACLTGHGPAQDPPAAGILCAPKRRKTQRWVGAVRSPSSATSQLW